MGLTIVRDGNGQTIPRRKATISLDNKTLKHSLAVHFQSYPLALLAEKEQLATASAIFGNYDSTQSATPILVTRNAEPIRQNIQFRNTKCIQSGHSILGLSIGFSLSYTVYREIFTVKIFSQLSVTTKITRTIFSTTKYRNSLPNPRGSLSSSITS